MVALACAVAPSWPCCWDCGLLGVTLAGLPAVATAYLREELHAGTHARAAGLYIGGTALGGMTGRLVAGPLADVARLAAGRWPRIAARRPRLRRASSGCCCRRPAASSPRPPRAAAHLLAMTGRAGPRPRRCWRSTRSAPARWARSWRSTTSLGFRLTSAPFDLGLGAAGLVFLVYPVGTLGSSVAGRLADRYGRRAVVPVGCAVTAAGVLVTLARPLPVVVLGLAVMTAGFFAVHGVASGWVATRAHPASAARARPPRCTCSPTTSGSSVFGSVTGTAWAAGGWSPVVLLSLVLVLVGLGLSLALRRMPSLLEPAARSGSADTSPATP